MAAAQIRGLASDIKAIRETMRATLEAVRAEASAASADFAATADMVKADIKDIRDATAELRGEVAQGTNGGEPPENAPETSPPATETRAATFGAIAPGLRRQNF